MRVFLHNDYVDTLGVKVEKGMEVNIRFMGEMMIAKVIDILQDGIKVEILE